MQVEGTESERRRVDTADALDPMTARLEALTTRLSLPLVYLAAPYSSPDPETNVRRVIAEANGMLDAGLFVPYVPHLTHLWHEVEPRGLDDWYSYDLVILARCDALLRLEGQSRGADLEVVFAEQRGIPAFLDRGDLDDWVATRSTEGQP